VIRFSAALVAVAIGVLIGGIAASELLLVYIAIVLSAVALAALAVGVVLKREELFGERRGLTPAQAGASPGQPARADEARAGDVNVGGIFDRVTPPPLQGAAVGPGAVFAGHSQAVSPQPGATPGNRAGRDSWEAPPAAAPVPGTWQAPAASGSTAGWGTSAPSVFAPRTADTPAAAAPDWFGPAGRTAGAEAPATAPVPAAGGGGWSWLNGDTPVSQDAGSRDAGSRDAGSRDTGPEDKDEAKPEDAALDDDDWPTRYSWLDDEPEEDGEAADGKSPDADVTANIGDDDKADAGDEAEEATAAPAGTATETDSRVPGGFVAEAAAAEPASAPVPDEFADDADPDDGPGDRSSRPAPAAPAPPSGAPEGEFADTGTDEPDQETDEPPTLHLVRDPDLKAEAARAIEPEGEPPAAAAADSAAGDTEDLVSVVRGVPRFHLEDCVLIRFMPAADTQKMPVAQARAAGCTPCTACQPEG
jgi:hypothetical protein